MAYSPDGKRLASAGREGVKVWDAQTGQEAPLSQGAHRLGLQAWPSARTANAWPALLGDNTVKVWDAQTGQETPHPQG